MIDEREETREALAALDAEEHLLAVLLLSSGLLVHTFEVPTGRGGFEQLTAAHFYDPAHREVFAAISALYGEGAELIDDVTVADRLRTMGTLDSVGGSAALVDLMTNAPVLAERAVVAYARIILRKALQRRMLDASEQIQGLAFSHPDDVNKAVDEAERVMARVSHVGLRQQRRLVHYDDAGDELLADIESTEPAPIIPSGLSYLDDAMDVQPAEVVVAAALTGHGKTTFAAHFADAAAAANWHVLYLTREMPAKQIRARLAARDAEVDSRRIRRRELAPAEKMRLRDVIERRRRLPLWFDEADNTLSRIEETVRRHLRDSRLDLLVVDHLQLVAQEPGGRMVQEREHLDHLSSWFKDFAVSQGVAVLELVQFNRGAGGLAGRPALPDLRGSAAIAHSADWVLGIYDSSKDPTAPIPGQMELNSLKARSGAQAGPIIVRYEPRFHRLTDLPRSAWAGVDAPSEEADPVPAAADGPPLW